MSKFSEEISKYSSARSLQNSVSSISKELDDITNGRYRSEILLCRKILNDGDKIGYKLKKSTLPAVTFSGLFNGSHKAENLISYTYHIIIDIDAIEQDELSKVKNVLFGDEHVFAVWISPSGIGLKVLVKVLSQPIDHKKCYDVMVDYLTTKYKIQIDTSGSDVSRLCYVSFDENLLQKSDVKLFDFNNHYVEPEIKTTTKIESPSRVYTKPSIHLSDRILFYGTEGKNLQRNRDSIISYIRYLRKKEKSITGNYHDWFRVACAISNSFTFDIGLKYFLELCRLDGVLHDEYKSQQVLEYCYRNRRMGAIDFSTIVYLVKDQGFVLKSKKPTN